MKVAIIIGARPQFIKAAVVSHVFKKYGGIEETLVHTGQHFDSNMSDVFFDELGILKPEYNLGIGGGLHGAMTGAQLAGIEKVLLLEKPDWVLVYGDTNSTLAGALAASKLNISVAHVEAGLRSFNRRMPEEINRVVADHVSDLLFAPTELAMQHLEREGISASKCHQVGDVMFDAALLFGNHANQSSDILHRLSVESAGFVLATVHRAENTDDFVRLRTIVSALGKVSKSLPVIWPLHPRTRALLKEYNLYNLMSNVRLLEPVGYLDMVMLEQNAAVIATDSGGVQKEAFFYQVPCITLREETEWVELLDAGWNKLVPPLDESTISREVLGAIGSRGEPITPYGDGKAGEKIANILLR